MLFFVSYVYANIRIFFNARINCTTSGQRIRLVGVRTDLAAKHTARPTGLAVASMNLMYYKIIDNTTLSSISRRYPNLKSNYFLYLYPIRFDSN